MSDKWCTIESDPGVFTELIEKLGVKGVQVEELITLDDEELDRIKPIYGLIFLFKWVKETEPRNVLEAYDKDLFFAKQVVIDACATQALLSLLLNCKDIDIGNDLKTFKEFGESLDPNGRGWAIANSDKIREIHNSFTPQDSFFFEESSKKGGKQKDVFHFITYVPHQNYLYELDGLQPGPILLGECNDHNWLNLAREEITKRIEKYTSQQEIRFNLMALIHDRRDKAKREIDNAGRMRACVLRKLNKPGCENTEIDEDLYKSLPEDEPQLNEILKENELLIARNQDLLYEETEKHERWKQENIRRKHNYTPLIFEMIKILAEKNELPRLLDEAEEKQKKRLEEIKKASEEAKAQKL